MNEEIKMLFADTFLTINQTADYLGMKRSLVRRLQKEGKVPGFYIGTRYYVNVPLFAEKFQQIITPYEKL